MAVIREEGSNGDREMVAAFHMAGFEVWDVNMHDLCSGAINLDKFRGIAFVGGFSYADVLGSAKGEWRCVRVCQVSYRAWKSLNSMEFHRLKIKTLKSQIFLNGMGKHGILCFCST